MQDDAREAQCVGAVELARERRDRAPAKVGIGRSQVDEVAGVRHDRLDAELGGVGTEGVHLVRRERSGTPLAGGLREDLQRVTAGGVRALDGARQAAGDRHVGAEAGHGLLLYPACRPGVGSRAP